jgi:hypothetical protein
VPAVCVTAQGHLVKIESLKQRDTRVKNVFLVNYKKNKFLVNAVLAEITPRAGSATLRTTPRATRSLRTSSRLGRTWSPSCSSRSTATRGKTTMSGRGREETHLFFRNALTCEGL